MNQIARQVTSFTKLVGDQELLQFAGISVASDAIQEFLAAKPDEEGGLTQTIMWAYALDSISNA